MAQFRGHIFKQHQENNYEMKVETERKNKKNIDFLKNKYLALQYVVTYKSLFQKMSLNVSRLFHKTGCTSEIYQIQGFPTHLQKNLQISIRQSYLFRKTVCHDQPCTRKEIIFVAL